MRVRWKFVLTLALAIVVGPCAFMAVAGGAQKLYAAFVDFTEGTANTAPSGHSSISADSGTHKLKASLNGAAPVVIPTVGGGDIDLSTSTVTGTAPIARGGTNSSTALSGSSIMVSNGTQIVQGAAGTSTTLLHGNASGTPTYSAVSMTADVTGTLPTGNGGTGLSSYTAGDIPYYASGTALSKLASNGTGNNMFLRTVGGGNPAYAQVGLSDLTGFGTGGIGYGNAGTAAALAIGQPGQQLTVNAGGTAPQWSYEPATNLLINGGMDFVQRGDPTTGAAFSAGSASYVFDRWKGTGEGSAHGTITVTRVAADSGITASYAQLWTHSAGTAGKGAMWETLEYSSTKPLRSRTLTFQVFMKASTSTTMRMGVFEFTGTADTGTGISAVFSDPISADGTDPARGTSWSDLTATNLLNTTIQNHGVSGGTCSVTTSWQNFAVTVTVGSSTNNLAVAVWSENDIASAATVRFAQAGLYDSTGVREWLPRSYQQELALCQRYFCKTMDVDTAPTNTTSATTKNGLLGGLANPSGIVLINWQFPVTMFKAPTSTYYSYITGTSAKMRDASGAADRAASDAAINTTCLVGTSSGSASGANMYMTATADADF